MSNLYWIVMPENIRTLIKDKDFRKIVIIFIICKIFVVSIAVGTQFFVPATLVHTEKVTNNIFLNPFAQYDATAYLDIAENGYRENFSVYKIGNYQWYPLYPLLIKTFSFVSYPLSAFLVSNIASFLAITLLYALVNEELGKRAANRTIFYIIFFPTAFYFTVMYSESLFLLLSVATFYFARKNNWLATGVLGFLASLTRIQGVLLLIPIAYMYMRHVGFDFGKIKKNALYILGVPLGVLTFIFYEYIITGNAFVQFKNQAIFGKALSWPWTGFIHAVNSIFVDTTLINMSYHIYNLVITAFFIALLYVSYKKLKQEYTIYYAISLILVLMSSNLYGVSRYLLVTFPAFMALATIDNKNNYVKYGIIIIYFIFILLMAGFIVLHVTERISTPLLYTPLF